MLPIEDLLLLLSNLGVQLWDESGDLRITAPKGALTPDLVSQIKERKSEVITFIREYKADIRKDESVSSSLWDPVEPVPRDVIHPLSFAQQRLWFLERFEERVAPTYHICKVLRLKGLLCVPTLESCFSEMVRRHETLRTVFELQGNHAVQKVQEPWRLLLTMVDLRNQSSGGSPPLQHLISAQADRRFDLHHGPLVRAVLLRLAPDESVLIVSLHHIISDGWSAGVMVRELAALYNAYVQNRPSPLPELSIQYVDFTHWQRSRISASGIQKQLDFWKKSLAGTPELLELPYDRPRPGVQTFRGRNQTFRVDSDLMTGVYHLCRQHQVTPFMLLQAVFSLLLGRYSGQNDFLMGSPMANRNRPEFEPLIGFFVNTLVFRAQLQGDPLFSELLERVRTFSLAAFSAQEIPFEQLVDALKPNRSLSYSPLFQVMFALQNAPSENLRLSGLDVIPMGTDLDVAKFDLTLYLVEAGEGLDGLFEYNVDLFDAETIQRMSVHFRNLLKAVVARPQDPVSQLPLLDPIERKHLIHACNRTRVPYPSQNTVHGCFEAQVKRTPDRAALSFKRGHQSHVWTYEQLNQRANQIALRLKAMGAQPEMLVGLLAARGGDMVAGLLAILKLGAAYLPLDATYPKERLALMVADSRLRILVTSGMDPSQYPPGPFQNLCLDELSPSSEPIPAPIPTPAHGPDLLAYVMYTSGSTGVPKGVQVSHRCITRLIFGAAYARFEGGRNLLQLAPTSFDAATLELWAPLLHGGRCVLFPNDELTTASLGKALRQGPVDTLWLTASLFNLTIDEKPEILTGVQQLLVGGEALSVPHVRRAFDQLPGTRLINGYGPTESTTFACCFPITQKPGARAGSIPIGRPISNTTVFVLDRNMALAPFGVPGELFIGGDGLARGYLARPGLTAERFVPNPFQGTGSRLYRTGDLVRYQKDKNIAFLGRVDHQVKIRGFRIEPGEVEHGLANHESVRQAAVVLRSTPSGNKRLVAFVEPVEGYRETNSANLQKVLTAYLSGKLPEYMVPASIEIVTTMPLSPNGKVDRDRLPDADGRPENKEGFVAPETATEKALADLWMDVLGLETISMHDNFFQLGGDSILSIQLVARASRSGLHFTAKDLFKSQTIAALAKVVGTTAKTSAEQGRVSGSFPLTPIQRWFFDRDQPDPHHFNQALLFSLKSPSDPTVLERIEAILCQHHDALRQRFKNEKGQWQAACAHEEKNQIFQFVDLSGLSASLRSRALEQIAGECQAALDLEHGPLWKMVYFRMGHGCSDRLLFTIHHLAVDGVSWRILLEDWHHLYHRLGHGREPDLALKTTSYRDWARGQHAYAQTQQAAADLDHWLALADRKVKPLPVDFDQPGGPNQVGSTALVSTSLGSDHTQALLRSANSAYGTEINDLLIAPLVQVFTRWSTSDTLLLALEGHGREPLLDDVDLSRTVGWFTSLYPILLVRDWQTSTEPGDLLATEPGGLSSTEPGGLSSTEPGGLLKSVKEQLRAVSKRGIGFGLLRFASEDPEIRAKLSALPSPQVSFNYLGQSDRVLAEDSPLSPASESPGALMSPKRLRTHLFEITAMVQGGELHVNWTYGKHFHRSETVGRLASDYLSSLETLIDHCLLPETGGFTPSDFPLAAIDQPSLDGLQGMDSPMEDLYPLTPMQEGMLHHSLQMKSGSYINQISCRLRGELDLEAFKEAWRRLLARHPIARTSFHWEGLEQSLQRVHEKVSMDWRIEDWSGLAKAERSRKLDTYLRTDRTRGFSLARAPLMRCALFQWDKGTDPSNRCHQFIWTHHHLLFDGWSLSLLFKDLFTYYRKLCGTKGDVPPFHTAPPPAFRRYVAWLRQQDLEKAKAFWRTELKGFSSPTFLKVVNPRRNPPLPESDYQMFSTPLSAEVFAALEQVARRYRLTLNALFQSAWAILLSRYSGNLDVLFGATVSGRPGAIEEVGSMVGLFINTLPTRIDLSQGEALHTWLRGIAHQQVAREEFSFTPLVKIHAWSEIPKKQPLFESLFAFENYPVNKVLQQDSGGLQCEDIQVQEQSDYPLTMIVLPQPNPMVRLRYDLKRYSPQIAVRLAAHFQTILAGIAADQNQIPATVSMLNEGERRQLLEEWNATQTPFPEDRCAHQLFERQAARNPEAIAVSSAAGQISYGLLNARANGLALHLKSLGVGAETLVGIAVDRGHNLVVGILAILKAGAAYMPLDPGGARLRNRIKLNHSRVRFLLAKQSFLEAVAMPELIAIDLDAPGVWEGPKPLLVPNPKDPLCPVGPQNLVYLLYTSGSTGKPKGVAISHGSLVNYLTWCMTAYETERGIGAPVHATMTFDATVTSFWTPLVSGKTVWLVSEELAVEELSEALFSGLPFSLAKITPAHLGLLARLCPESQASCSTRRLVIGGEALLPGVLDFWRRKMPGAPLINEYGPTETVVGCCIYDAAGEPEIRDAVPIGKPIQNMKVYILDPALRPAPVQHPGEIYIAGFGLARGYFGQPALTAVSFIPDPFDTRGGGRLYRTGDWAYVLPGGDRVFLGRADHQVQIRGSRVELGEIEAALALHPQIAESAVLVRSGEAISRGLAAYLVFDGDPLPNQDLRAYLRDYLPDAAIPEIFVPVDAMPLTAEGKVDRAALGESVEPRGESKAAFEAARTRPEQLLSEIWTDLLNLDQVSIHANFFELGGDSILNLQAVARARKAGLQIVPKQLFDHPTIAELAAVAAQSKAVQAEQGPISGSLPLTPIQRWFFEIERPRPDYFNQALLFHPNGALDPEILVHTIAELQQHHDVLRLRFRQENNGWQQMHGPLECEPPFEVCHLGEAWSDKAVTRAATKFQTGLNLAEGPLWRAVLFQSGDTGDDVSQRLLIVVHHLAVGWRFLAHSAGRLSRNLPKAGGGQGGNPSSQNHFL